MVDDETIKEFQTKLDIFAESFRGISNDFSKKLEDLGEKTKDISDKTDFLKEMKKTYDDQNKKLELMDATINEVLDRLESIQNGGASEPSKHKKKKRKK